jgi:hypothetical protein
MAETIRCPFCNRENDSTATRFTKCDAFVRSELGYLREIDTSLKTIKTIAIQIPRSLTGTDREHHPVQDAEPRHHISTPWASCRCLSAAAT